MYHFQGAVEAVQTKCGLLNSRRCHHQRKQPKRTAETEAFIMNLEQKQVKAYYQSLLFMEGKEDLIKKADRHYSSNTYEQPETNEDPLPLSLSFIQRHRLENPITAPKKQQTEDNSVMDQK